MAEIYQYVTQAAARQEIANRLYDSQMVFWTSAELTLYLQEALRTWNALTGYWRGDFLFSTSPANPTGVWYDLTQQTNSLRQFTVKDTDLYTLLQYHLLEPISWNPWVGNSSQYTADDLLNAVARRQDEILSVTGCRSGVLTAGAVLGRISLPDTAIDIIRMAYFPAVGSPSVVWPSDTWDEQAFNAGWPNNPAGTPFAFLLSTEPPLSFDVDVPPGSGGNYEMLVVQAGAGLSIGTPSTFYVPNDWTHVIKWGALADLFSKESNARDPLRAQYCNQRFQMGMRLLAQAPALLALRLGNTVLQIDSAREGDLYNPTWQAQAPGTPNLAYYAGLNQLGLSPTPDSNSGNNYSLTATVVENAPLPASDADFVQVSREDYDVLIDYCQHLASLKMGGAEFVATMPLFKRFMDQAAIYNAKLKELGEYTTTLFALGQRQEYTAPRMELPTQ